jgi:hypothetical protein
MAYLGWPTQQLCFCSKTENWNQTQRLILAVERKQSASPYPDHQPSHEPLRLGHPSESRHRQIQEVFHVEICENNMLPRFSMEGMINAYRTVPKELLRINNGRLIRLRPWAEGLATYDLFLDSHGEIRPKALDPSCYKGNQRELQDLDAFLRGYSSEWLVYATKLTVHPTPCKNVPE